VMAARYRLSESLSGPALVDELVRR
jgi:hypothetical protein